MSGTPQRPRLLSHLQVLELLHQQSDQQASNKHKQFVQQKTIQYIESTNAKKFGTSEHAQKMVDQLVAPKSSEGSLQLMPAEALQVVNTVPTEAVEAHLIVENPDEKRLNETVVQQLLDQVQQHQTAAPKPPPTASTKPSSTSSTKPEAATLNGNHHRENSSRKRSKR